MNDSKFSVLILSALSSHLIIWKTLLKPFKGSKSTSLANTVAPYQSHRFSLLRLLVANNMKGQASLLLITHFSSYNPRDNGRTVHIIHTS